MLNATALLSESLAKAYPAHFFTRSAVASLILQPSSTRPADSSSNVSQWHDALYHNAEHTAGDAGCGLRDILREIAPPPECLAGRLASLHCCRFVPRVRRNRSQSEVRYASPADLAEHYPTFF